MKERITAWIDAHEEEMLACLAELIEVPSVSDSGASAPGAPFGPECRRALDRGLALAKKLGFETQDVDGYCGVASMGMPHPSIGIAAHLDVVPAGEHWIYPPFSMTRAGEYVIGRGSQDNKASAVLGLYAMKCLRDLNVELPCGIRLLMGTSEETGMEDIRYFAQHGDAPELTLVADCDYPVCYGQKGHYNAWVGAKVQGIRACCGGQAPNLIPDHAWIEVAGLREETVCEVLRGGMDIWTEPCEGGVRVHAKGKSGHAAFPQGADNAVRRLLFTLRDAKVLDAQDQEAVEALASLMKDDFGSACGLNVDDPVFGPLTLVGSMLKVEDGRMALSLDGRFPRMLSGSQVDDHIRAFASARGLAVSEASSREAFYIDKDDPLVRCMMDVYREETGDAREAFVMGGGTYSHVLARAVTFGASMPGAGVGLASILPPGHGGAHQPDEALHVPSFKRSLAIYVQTLMRLSPLVSENK